MFFLSGSKIWSLLFTWKVGKLHNRKLVAKVDTDSFLGYAVSTREKVLLFGLAGIFVWRSAS